METNVVIYIVLEIASFVWAVSRDGTNNGGFIDVSDRDVAMMFWVAISVVFTLIYGGIFWW